VIHPKPINPHLDIEPTEQHTIQLTMIDDIRPVYEGKRTKNKDPADYTINPRQNLMAVVHDPDGRAVGTITPERLAVLYAKYQRTSRETPHLIEEHSVGSFAADVARLLLRYKQGSKVTGRDNGIKLENHWAVPPKVFKALKGSLSLQKERFASPLNCNPDMEEYWSIHEADSLFGARYNSYKCRWTGPSEANAEYEHDELFKAMRWAVHSALQPEPTLTLLVHPAWDEGSSTAYYRWLEHCGGVAQVMMRIPRKRFKFIKPTQWTDQDPLAGHPKWDVNLIVAANPQGWQAYSQLHTEEGRACLYSQMAAALTELLGTEVPMEEVQTWWQLPDSWTPDTVTVQQALQSDETLEVMRRPKQHKNAKPDACHRPWHSRSLVPTTTELQALFPPVGQLAMPWDMMAYTDGSASKVKDEDTGAEKKITGAGVFIPAPLLRHTKALDPTHQQWEGRKGHRLKADPGPPGYTNTITRAELVALLTYQQWSEENGVSAGVATDSYAAMMLIAKMVQAPHKLLLHPHRWLLWEIMRSLEKRTSPLHIYKVKSHTGVMGNELADLTAKQAAKTSSDTDGEPCPHKVLVGAEPHLEDKWAYWLEYQPPPKSGGDTVAEPRPLRDVDNELTKLCHEENRLGEADTSSIYYTKMQEALPDMLPATSNKYKTSTVVAWAAKRTVMAYHSGCLGNQKIAHRDGYAKSPDCQLCGQLDGGHHALSACPAMERPVTERHHGLVRMITKALLLGKHGNGVVMMDAGSKDKRQEAGIPQRVGHQLPRDLLPDTLSELELKEAQRRLKPDIVLATKRKAGKSRTIHIVEVKYCRDTDKTLQERRAEAQHQELLKLLRTKHRHVKLHTLLVGVGGSVYKAGRDTLIKLGVDRNAAMTFLEKINIYTVNQAQSIISIRRQKEAQVRAERGEPPRAWPRGPQHKQRKNVRRKKRRPK